MNCRYHNRRRGMRVQGRNRAFAFCFLFCLEIDNVLCIVSMFFIAAHNMTEGNGKQNTDNVNTQIADRGKYIEHFIDKAGFFGQYKEIDRSKIILGVFLALPSEVKNGMTQKMLAQYLGVDENTLTARRYGVEVGRIQKAACMQFLQCNSTTKVLEYIVAMATGETDFNPAPAQKLYLQFIEGRSEKIALDTNAPITVVFGGGKSSFVNSEDDEEDDHKKTKVTPVRTTDTTKGSVKKKISRLVDTAKGKKK